MANELDSVFLAEEERKKKEALNLSGPTPPATNDLFKNPIAPSSSPEQAGAFAAMYPPGTPTPDFKTEPPSAVRVEAQGGLVGLLNREIPIGGVPRALSFARDAGDAAVFNVIGGAKQLMLGKEAGRGEWDAIQQIADRRVAGPSSFWGEPASGNPPAGALPPTAPAVQAPPAGALPPTAPAVQAPPAGALPPVPTFTEGLHRDRKGVLRNDPSMDVRQSMLARGAYQDADGVWRNDKKGVESALSSYGTPETRNKFLDRASTLAVQAAAPIAPAESWQSADSKSQVLTPGQQMRQYEDWKKQGSPMGSDYEIWKRQQEYKASGNPEDITRGFDSLGAPVQEKLTAYLDRLAKGNSVKAGALAIQDKQRDLDAAQAVKPGLSTHPAGWVFTDSMGKSQVYHRSDYAMGSDGNLYPRMKDDYTPYGYPAGVTFPGESAAVGTSGYKGIAVGKTPAAKVPAAAPAPLSR